MYDFGGHTFWCMTTVMVDTGDSSLRSFVPTFYGDVNGLVDRHLGLDQNTAQVGALVRTLLHVCEPQGAVLKDHLTMIIGQLHAVLQPLDGVIRVANHTAGYVGIPACYCGHVPHGSDSRWTWRHRGEKRGWRE